MTFEHSDVHLEKKTNQNNKKIRFLYLRNSADLTSQFAIGFLYYYGLCVLLFPVTFGREQPTCYPIQWNCDIMTFALSCYS